MGSSVMCRYAFVTIQQQLCHTLVRRFLNTFNAGLIQAARATTACSHVDLGRHNSGAESTRELLLLQLELN